MAGKFHGVFSLILILAAVAMALFYILRISLGWGLVYLAIVILANPLILYSYCAKCSCRKTACSHILPGRLAQWLPARKPGPYSIMDYIGTATSLGILLGFPQVWLWHNLAMFILFWMVLLVGLVEILFFVCHACDNDHCPINASLHSG